MQFRNQWRNDCPKRQKKRSIKKGSILILKMLCKMKMNKANKTVMADKKTTFLFFSADSESIHCGGPDFEINKAPITVPRELLITSSREKDPSHKIHWQLSISREKTMPRTAAFQKSSRRTRVAVRPTGKKRMILPIISNRDKRSLPIYRYDESGGTKSLACLPTRKNSVIQRIRAMEKESSVRTSILLALSLGFIVCDSLLKCGT